MRIRIESEDRIGISHEILAVLAEYQINIKALEVGSGFTFAELDLPDEKLTWLNNLMKGIQGVLGGYLVEWLPTESREKHLNTLLSRIPDAIIDVDEYGTVIMANESAVNLFEGSVLSDNTSIVSLLGLRLQTLKNPEHNQVEVSINGKNYLAEISRVLTDGNFNGAVIVINPLDKLGRQLSLVQQSDNALSEIIGDSETIIQLKQNVNKFSELDLPVLILGETGTGKELFARAIHRKSPRSKAPFLAINCAALPEHLLESELFGYAAGAFTGAQKGGKPGLFELAEGGTVFLDEIAEMSTYLQAKLLRFLQDFHYRRVGGTQEQKANVRVITATHQNLSNLIEHQKFREDLYYRLNVLNLSLPPLRSRTKDIGQLVSYFIHNAANQVDKPAPTITEEAISYLKSYGWPGNIRQLQNLLFRLVALNEGALISAHDVTQALGSDQQVKAEQASTAELNVTNTWLSFESWEAAQAAFEKELLREYLPLHSTTRKLADRLQVSHNKIAMKLRKHNIKKTW